MFNSHLCMLSHYWNCYMIHQMQGWRGKGVTDGDECVKALSRTPDNFLTTLSRAEAASVTSTSLESVISLCIAHLKQFQLISSVSNPHLLFLNSLYFAWRFELAPWESSETWQVKYAIVSGSALKYHYKAITWLKALQTPFLSSNSSITAESL